MDFVRLPEEIEFIESLPEAELEPFGGKIGVIARFLRVAEAVADFYLEQTPTDGVPYWDTGAPGLAKMGDYLDRPAEPFNEHEPVDSSAAAIAAQGVVAVGLVPQAAWEHGAGRALLPGGADGGADAFPGALSLNRSGS